MCGLNRSYIFLIYNIKRVVNTMGTEKLVEILQG